MGRSKSTQDADKVLDVPCKFGAFSGGDSASIRVQIPNAHINTRQCDFYLANTELSLTAILDPNATDDSPSQQTFEDADRLIELTVRVPSYRRSDKQTSATLNFASADLDDDEVLTCFHLGNQHGRIRARKMPRSKAKKGGDDADE